MILPFCKDNVTGILKIKILYRSCLAIFILVALLTVSLFLLSRLSAEAISKEKHRKGV